MPVKKYKNEANFRVAGVTFENRQHKLRHLKAHQKGAYLTARREKNNKYDENAIAMLAHMEDGTVMQIGYVPASQAAFIAPAIDANDGKCRVRDFKVTGGGQYNLGCAVTLGY